jgi:hypothetical protein
MKEQTTDFANGIRTGSIPRTSKPDLCTKANRRLKRGVFHALVALQAALKRFVAKANANANWSAPLAVDKIKRRL